MSFWKPPQLPAPEKPPPAPESRRARGPNRLARGVATVAGLAFTIASLVGVWSALHDRTGQASPFRALALLIPSVILLRYALTGQIKR